MNQHKNKETPGAGTPGETFTIEQIAELLQKISDRVDGLEIKINAITEKVQPRKPRESTFSRGGVM